MKKEEYNKKQMSWSRLRAVIDRSAAVDDYLEALSVSRDNEDVAQLLSSGRVKENVEDAKLFGALLEKYGSEIKTFAKEKKKERNFSFGGYGNVPMAALLSEKDNLKNKK